MAPGVSPARRVNSDTLLRPPMQVGGVSAPFHFQDGHDMRRACRQEPIFGTCCCDDRLQVHQNGRVVLRTHL